MTLDRRYLLSSVAILAACGVAGVASIGPRERVLRPEMFGRIGISPDGDTAAWVALAEEARAEAARSGRATVEAEGQYNILGSLVQFRDVPILNLRLGRSRFRQQQRFSKTLQFINCHNVSVSGGEGYGLGRAGREYDGARAAYNGVAFLYFEDCDSVSVSDSNGFDHAGGCFVVRGGRIRRFENVQTVGIGVGPGGIPDPAVVTNADLRNGSDFGIMCVPIEYGRGWIFEDEFINCRTRDSAFGIQTVQTARCHGRGNRIGPHPGQHGVYGIDLDGVDWQSNTFEDCAQLAFKNQLENYAGRLVGTPWAPGTSYVVGEQVRFSSTLWEVAGSHSSGARPDLTRFRRSALNTRGAGLYANNTVRRCLSGFAQIAIPPLDGSSIVSEGWKIESNVIEESTGEPLRLDRMMSCEVVNNTISGAIGTAILALDFSGSIRRNSISTTQMTAINIVALGPVRIEDNEMSNVALNGSNEQHRTPVVISGPGPMNSRIRPGAVRVSLSRNVIRWGVLAADRQNFPEPPARWLYLVTDPSVTIDAADLVSDPSSPRSFSIPSPTALRSSVRNSFSRITNNANTPILTNP